MDQQDKHSKAPTSYSSTRGSQASSHFTPTSHYNPTKDKTICPDLLITIEAAVRDSYVVLKDSRCFLLVSHKARPLPARLCPAQDLQLVGFARPSEARDRHVFHVLYWVLFDWKAAAIVLYAACVSHAPSFTCQKASERNCHINSTQLKPLDLLV